MKRKLYIGGWLLWLAVLFFTGCSPGSPAPVYDNEAAARGYLTAAPTFKYDGIPATLQLVSTTVITDGAEYSFKFDCAHAGYGDRSGQITAQVITTHTMVIRVIRGKVTSSVIDDRWDELAQKLR